jgi:imidazolonepropionase-like amidohydrolase
LLGWAGQIDSLKSSRIADGVAVPGDPLQDTSLLQKVSFLMKGGVFLKR